MARRVCCSRRTAAPELPGLSVGVLPVLGVVAYLVAWLLLPWQDGSIPLQRLLGGGGTQA